jgi:hypothetical protein
MIHGRVLLHSEAALAFIIICKRSTTNNKGGKSYVTYSI